MERVLLKKKVIWQLLKSVTAKEESKLKKNSNTTTDILA
jgi:hypothetical protein